MSAAVVRSYQMSSRRIAEIAGHLLAIAADGRQDRCPPVARRVNPFARAAIRTLTASRLTSHSHGPGSVSSKSFESKTRVRSGEANSPKFERCPSPLAWTTMSLRGVVERSKAMTAGAPR